MAKMFKEKTAAVLSHLQANRGTDEIAADIAAATGIPEKSVQGTLTGLQKKGLIERVAKEGFEKKVIVLTEAGAAVDPDAEVE